jgi:hypothetical protein
LTTEHEADPGRDEVLVGRRQRRIGDQQRHQGAQEQQGAAGLLVTDEPLEGRYDVFEALFQRAGRFTLETGAGLHHRAGTSGAAR